MHERKIRPVCLVDMAREMHTLTNFPSSSFLMQFSLFPLFIMLVTTDKDHSMKRQIYVFDSRHNQKQNAIELR